MEMLSGDLSSYILDQQNVEKFQRRATKLIHDLQDCSYVTEFWKITHTGVCEIIRIFMIGGFLLRAEHT